LIRVAWFPALTAIAAFSQTVIMANKYDDDDLLTYETSTVSNLTDDYNYHVLLPL